MARYDVNFHNDARIADAVDRPIPPELISKRSAGNNTSYSYLRGDIDADRLNEIFGPLGWGAVASPPEITRFEDKRTVYREVPNQRNKQPINVDMTIYVVTTQVTVTIKRRTPESTDTIFTQTGVGYGEVEVGRHAKDAVAMAVKGAETDGFKRCTSKLGKAFGLFLTSSGSQDAIDYAHNNDAGNRRHAHQLAKHREGQEEPATPSTGAATPPVQERQRKARKSEGGQRGPSEQAQDQMPRQQSAPEAETKAREPGEPSEGRKQERPQRPPNEQYDLQTKPITRDDQIDFAATILARVRASGSQIDRSGLLRSHIRTINPSIGSSAGGCRKSLQAMISISTGLLPDVTQ